jgi:hypothetical protein
MQRPEFFLTFVPAAGATCCALLCWFTAALLWNPSELSGLLEDSFSSLVRLGIVSAFAGLFIAAFRTGLRD